MSTTCFFSLLIALGLAAGVDTRDSEIDFNRDIRPILSDNCYSCHGPDENQRQAGLRLDLQEPAHSQAILPGEPDDSLLVERIIATETDSRMPPSESGKRLTANQIDLLKKWIAEGAVYDRHWSFVAPTKASTPESANPIDHFVSQQLAEADMDFSPPASRITWLRRITLDLTGLPPTLAEIDAFVADRSDTAYTSVVDRLLASPAYGERMASDWLDVARYSDSYGYQVDRDRRVWPWRDWVIRAFNENKPFDQFLTEQLAGDLLPAAEEDQILATTFNRLHPQKVEGGSEPEEFRIEYVADRLQTVGTAFMGLTLECCRCHHHKFDPISQEEYYQLSAFFDNIDEAGLYSYFTNSVPTPTLSLPSPFEAEQLDVLSQAVEQAEQELEVIRQRQADQASDRWTDQRTGQESSFPIEPPIAYLDFESDIAAPNQAVDGRRGRGVQLTGDDPIDLQVGNFPRWQPFSISLWMKATEHHDRAVIFHRSRAWTDAGSRGYQLLLEDDHLSFSLVHFMPGNALTVQTSKPIRVGLWTHVTVTYDGSSRADGVRLFVDGNQSELEVVRDQLTKQIMGGGNDHLSIGARFRDNGFRDGIVDDFRVFDRELSAIEACQQFDSSATTKKWSLDDVVEHFLKTDCPPFQMQLAELQSRRESLFQLQDQIEEIMVMRELPWRRETFVLDRGRYDARLQRVVPGTPATLPTFEDYPKNRLGLAQWLTSPRHPLTSRVTVNRIWQMLFGEGLVRTPEDFGRQGEVPTHPLLLDWLAVDLMENQWDIKRLIKSIALSRTYRQSSAPRIDSEGNIIDPENRLLARGPCYRWPAEILRDSALSISGLLVDQWGGPPVKTYELAESFKPSFPEYGPGLYRRSLYTYWRRTAPAPAMIALDASKRDVCRVKRERTASPLASLVLINGTQFVEAARATAVRVLQSQPENAESTLVEMFRLSTSRPPSDREIQIVRQLFERQLAYFQQHPEQRSQYLSTGEFQVPEAIDPSRLAAFSVVANMLFNLDESITKR